MTFPLTRRAPNLQARVLLTLCVTQRILNQRYPDIKREFFNSLNGRILIMCALDVDAICACRILQFLLESHNLQYTVAPVASIDNLCKSFEEYRSSIDTIITINFGNMTNIPRLLKPAKGLNFYVIDSHRPINVHNYYLNPQVKVFINKDERELKIPSKTKIFLKGQDGQIDQEEDESHIDLLEADVQELTNEQLEKRRKLREWLVNKRSLLFDYEQYHFYGRAVSLIMYDLAIDLSRNNNYLLWLGIVGLTSQLKSDKIPPEVFEDEALTVLRHIDRNQISTNHAKGNAWKIEWQKDLNLDLYRKWTFYHSLFYTPLTVCRFQLWNDKGHSNLLEFLVESGLKTEQCKKPYVAMDLEYRQAVFPGVSNVCLGDNRYKYNLEELITRCFIMKAGFKENFSAGDVVLAVKALLESSDAETSNLQKTQLTLTKKFVRAIQSLSHSDFTLLEEGFAHARTQMISMFEQVKNFITTMKIQDAGLFLHVDLQECDPKVLETFGRGDSLMSFARFLLHAYVSSKTTRLKRRAVRLPLVLFSPDDCDTEQVLVAGIPPVAQEAKKNFFGKAFETAASNLGCEIKTDLSETSLIRININYKIQLIEQMKQLLD